MIAGVAAAGAAAWMFSRPADAPFDAKALLSTARRALHRGEFARAESTALDIPADSSHRPAALLVAADAAIRQQAFERALAHLQAVPRHGDGADAARIAELSQADVLRELGRLSEAEEQLLVALDSGAMPLAVHERLAFLLGVSGRRWESAPHFLALIREGGATLDSLALFADLERPMEQGGFLRRCASAAPDDLLVQQGLAAEAAAEGRADEARDRLRQVLDRRPEVLSLQALYGLLLVDGPPREFRDWHAALPAHADESSDIWYARGLWARRQRKLESAARCFGQALQITPMHRRANYQFSQVLGVLGRAESAQFEEIASLQHELSGLLDQALASQGRHEPTLRRITEILERLGRVPEACAWAELAQSAFVLAPWPPVVLARLDPLRMPDTPQVGARNQPALLIDLSTWPPFVVEDPVSEPPPDSAAPPGLAASPGRIRFLETDAGVNFVYDNGDDPATPGARMFEQTGGGVAAVDFDADGWPDLYFTQGGDWPTGSPRPQIDAATVDRLYRNRRGARFGDVTAQARLVDGGFGQGVAAGDFDNDGFPDLYVAQIGPNQLLQNLGDGTFRETARDSLASSSDWTTSCLVADLDGDAHPDLFDVTYVSAPDVYERICNGRACSPKTFTGTPDRVLRSNGAGEWMPAEVEAPVEESKGLGVLAAAFSEPGRLELLVTNDQTPNHVFQNAAWGAGAIRLTEQAFGMGLAYNDDGLALAFMGIAADDADGDGLLDLCVTTFQNEPGALYRQDAPGLFVDITTPAGLRAPSLPFVGWGTQFIDADHDSLPDLVVVNGHVDDYRDEGGDYAMRPQVFRNIGGARFEELSPEQAGPFFGQPRLARALARLDWNGDGRMDLVAGCINEPAVLLTNDGSSPGRAIGVRLRGTHGARDPLGAQVDVSVGGRLWRKQLVGGDGFQSSNERLLAFGLGESAGPVSVQVAWPSGGTSRIREAPVDCVLEIVEDRRAGLLWRDNSPFPVDVEYDPPLH